MKISAANGFNRWINYFFTTDLKNTFSFAGLAMTGVITTFVANNHGQLAGLYAVIYGGGCAFITRCLAPDTGRRQCWDG